MSTFDPRYAADSIAPELSTEERSRYVAEELEKIQEMLEGAEDCKWLYQSLIQLSLLYRQITQQWPLELRQVEEWVHELVKLDGLRTTRWGDLWDSFKTS